MTSEQQGATKSDISPVLFMAVSGEPMSFFLRPGPVKCALQPLITAGGGMLCKVQQPGAILLLDPTERGSVAETTVHWYVSTEYIHDCIEKDEQLNLEDYRLSPEVKHSARLNTKDNMHGSQAGRLAYTAEDDAAILSYVDNHKTEIGGNRLWQEMEKQRVTSHSWQSMKYRYRVRLAKRQSEVVEVATSEEDCNAAEQESKVKENEETEKPSSAEDAASPQAHSTEADQTQVDVQSVPAEITQPEIVEAQISNCPEDKQTDQQPTETTKDCEEAEIYNSPRPEGPSLDSLTDVTPVPAESTESGADELQTIDSPQEEKVPEDPPSAHTSSQSPPDTSSQKKQKEKQSSPRPQQPQRRLTRRQLHLEESAPEPYSKKLRSSASSAAQPAASPQPSKKTKPAVKSVLEKDPAAEEPPSKKARGKSVAAVAEESQQEECGQAAVSETQADTESISVSQKKEKRKLGILEMATKEFESESDEDDAPDLQKPAETVTMEPAETEPPLPTPDTAASTQPSPAPEPDLHENMQETQASSSNCPPPAGREEPAAAEAADAISKPHLFIFDSESQEEDSQSIVCDGPAAPVNPQPTVSEDPAFSLTQVQLEEDKQRIRELMKETNQDLVSVTKALLKTSGDFSDARDLLLNPFSLSGPLWQCSDDDLLLSGDLAVRQQLQEKYGEELLAKRILFLELEG